MVNWAFLSTIVYEDNSASISLANNPGIHHKKSKHFGLEWSMFKESVEFGEIQPSFVKTDEQAADILTKPLCARKFIHFRNLVMGDERLQLHFVGPTSHGNPLEQKMGIKVRKD